MDANDSAPRQVRSDLPSWLLILIALSILTATMLLFVWARSVPGAERVMGDPGMFEHSRAITSVEGIVREPVKRNLLARDVILDEVRVVRVLGNYTFLVGSEESNVLVVLRGELTERQPEIATEIREGQVVRIYGTTRLMRSIREIADLTMLNVEEARTLADHEAYVSGERVVVLND